MYKDYLYASIKTAYEKLRRVFLGDKDAYKLYLLKNPPNLLLFSLKVGI